MPNGHLWIPLSKRNRMRLGASLLIASLLGLAAGGLAHLMGSPRAADAVWAALTVLGLAPALGWVVAALRRGSVGVDLIAVLALVGTLAIGEFFAGALITTMLATGRVLEARAAARAERDLRALLERTPRVAHRYTEGQVTDAALTDVRVGDLLLVPAGEVVPVDGRVESATAVLDESALTGEPLPVERAGGEGVRSGVVNAGAAFDLRATTTAADSTYAGIVRLVQQAQAGTAPFVRLADRYAAWFLAGTLVLAGAAWALSGDARRAVAVLVVATPCPLILAAPVAIMAGLSRAARRGVVVKGGAALEGLAAGEVLLFDKTGTLTAGRPTVREVVAPAGVAPERLLQLAASLDQVSPHVLAGAVVRAARERGLDLVLPQGAEEVPAKGICGTVAGTRVRVGTAGFVADDQPDWMRRLRRRSALDGSLLVFIAVDDVAAGALVLADPVRPDAARMVAQLRRSGISRVVMVTGDRRDVAETVGAAVGVDEVLAERTPAEKVDAVRAAGRAGRTIMVGDGINDAPALAAATVGVALGARGASASSEAADVVVTVDRLDRVAEAISIARRSRGIAAQSVRLGMGLSLAAMVAASLGLLAPAPGALLQEVIDVAAILNALRALSGGRQSARRFTDETLALGRRFAAEHDRLRPHLELLHAAASRLDLEPSAAAVEDVRAVYRVLVDELLPHERAENDELYPALAEALGAAEAIGPMSREHAEISHLVARLGRLLEDLPPGAPDPADARDVVETLYGLLAILRLHFAQEEESYFSLLEIEPVGVTSGVPTPTPTPGPTRNDPERRR